MDIQTSPTQPRRLRQVATTTTTGIFPTSDTSPTSPMTSSTDWSSRTIQEVRRELAHKVRHDWEFHWSGWDETDEKEKKCQANPAGREEEDDAEGKTEWRERDFSSPCPSPSPKPSSCSRHDTTFNRHGSSEMHAREKRRRRRGLLDEEMSWNAGLSHWMAQRDAWTGARLRRVHHHRQHHHQHLSPSFSAAAASSTTAVVDDIFSPGDAHRPNNTKASPSSEIDVIEEVPIPSSPLLSISTRLRESMTSEVHAQIYSKAVIRSMTPRTPLNLADVTNAIVAGWKTDGLWPPQSAAPGEQPQPQPPQQQQKAKTVPVHKAAWPGPEEKLVVRTTGKGDEKRRERKAGERNRGRK